MIGPRDLYAIHDSIENKTILCVMRGTDLGADDYVTKPFSITQLLARVSAFLRRARHDSPVNFTFGDYVLDVEACTLSKAGQEIILTPKEFKLLTLFAQREGKALTRDEILDKVWGYNSIAAIGVSTVVSPRCVPRSKPIPMCPFLSTP